MSSFMEILSGIPVNSVLREWIELLKESYILKEKEVEHLREKIQQLEQQLEYLLKDLAAKSESEQFVSHKGACFKKDFTGKFGKIVYCPKCRQSTFDFMDMFNCSTCHWHSPFKSYELQAIINELDSNIK